jgi:hypothetical protein
VVVVGFVVGIRGVMERVMAWTLFTDQSVIRYRMDTAFLGKRRTREMFLLGLGSRS